MENKRFNAKETKEILDRVNVRIKSAEKYGNYTEKSFMYTLLKVVGEHYEDLINKKENNN